MSWMVIFCEVHMLVSPAGVVFGDLPALYYNQIRTKVWFTQKHYGPGRMLILNMKFSKNSHYPIDHFIDTPDIPFWFNNQYEARSARIDHSEMSTIDRKIRYSSITPYRFCFSLSLSKLHVVWRNSTCYRIAILLFLVPGQITHNDKVHQYFVFFFVFFVFVLVRSLMEVRNTEALELTRRGWDTENAWNSICTRNSGPSLSVSSSCSPLLLECVPGLPRILGLFFVTFLCLCFSLTTLNPVLPRGFQNSRKRGRL